MRPNRLSLELATILILAAFGLSIVVSPASASPYPQVNPDDLGKERVYSPYAGRAYPDQVFFGDTHFHTNLSFDAGLIGTTLDAHDGYRMARGEMVISNTGQPVQLIRPLDFLVITDHAEMIGLAPAIRESNPLLLADPWGRWVHERFNAGDEGRMEAFADIIEKGTVKGINPFSSDDLTRSIWKDFVRIADQYYEPGRFTAMTGFEWSTTRTRPARPCRSRSSIATTPRTCGGTWPATKTRSAGAPSRFPTMAISAMA